MNNPTVISQTQDEKEHLTLKIGSPTSKSTSGDSKSKAYPTSKSTSGDSKSKAYVWADRKPMVQLTLDGPLMMIAPNPVKKGREHFRKLTSKSGIRVKSHFRKTYRDTTSPKSMLKLGPVDVPNNDPKLGESLRLVSKMRFDDLMRYRQIVFYNSKT
jgi:hypothetical protein